MNYYSKFFWIVKRLLLFSSRHPQARKRLCTPAGASSGKPDSNSLDCIVFFLTDVSATCFFSNLQILFSLPVMHNCIYILPFLGFKDTPFANFASSISENPLSQISSLNILCCYSLHNLSQYITYPKIYALMYFPLTESEQKFISNIFLRDAYPT